MKRIVLFGGNRKNDDRPLLTFAREALRKGHRIIVATDEVHLNMHTGDGTILKQRLDDEKIEYINLQNISKNNISKYVDKETVGLSINAIWKFNREVIASFKGRLYNYHAAKLPQERGAAPYSWKILSGNRAGGLTIHKVAEEFDTGDIVMSREILFPEECKVTADFYRYMDEISDSFLQEFLDKIEKNIEFIPERQDDSKSRYWPRLNAAENGYINWDWNVRDIELFINAFDEPHDGASTFIEGKKVRFKKCCSTEEEGIFHPFQAGIVFKKEKDRLYIAAPGGCLILEEVLDENGERINADIKLGRRFLTPYSFVEMAKTARSAYRADGIKIERKTS